MPDVLLIQPPIRDFYLTSKRTIPYGLASIAAALIKEGFSVEIMDALATQKSRVVDLPEEMTFLLGYYGNDDRSPFALFHHYKHFGYSFDHIGQKAKASGAFLVGISSLFTPYVEEAIKTAETIKNFHPGCKIVLGGHHPTALPEHVMKHPAVDFVLRGDGEMSMPRLARVIQNGRGIESVPGIVFRNGAGRLQIGDPAAVAHPDYYPIPANHLIKQHFYRRAKKGSVVVVASRGCPMKCTYCSVGASSYLNYGRRSVSDVLAEIEDAVLKFNAGFIDFEDENLSMDREWFLELLRGIKNRFNVYDLELRAMNGLFPHTLNEEVVRAMKNVGFKTLNLSLGSTSKKQLDRFQRPDGRKAFDDVVVLAEKFSLEAVGYIIAGAPFQNARDSLNDLVFLAQRRVLAGVSIFYPAPGSADYLLCQSLNLLPETYSLMRSSTFPLSHTTTRDESVTLLRLGRILNFIKYLIDRNTSIPAPAKPKRRIESPNERLETGKQLLQWFLFDGKIRGVSPDGSVFEHRASPALTNAFLGTLPRINVRGFTHIGQP